MKLIAYHITNLTDARYFAARGASMLGFSAKVSSIEQVNAIKDWVDVPGFFIELPNNASAEFIWEWQDRTGISTFLTSELEEETRSRFPNANWISFFNDAESGMELSHLFLSAEEFKEWSGQKEMLSDSAVYVDFNVTELHDVQDLIAGVLIKGSEEDKIGVKMYDAIDDFLDSIDIEY